MLSALEEKKGAGEEKGVEQALHVPTFQFLIVPALH
jgi:hypothetical protein